MISDKCKNDKNDEGAGLLKRVCVCGGEGGGERTMKSKLIDKFLYG